MKRQPDHTININGEFSPFTLLKISQIFREMAPGDILEIQECDPETRSDLARILPSGACRWIADQKTEFHGGTPCRIRLLKNAIFQ